MKMISHLQILALSVVILSSVIGCREEVRKPLSYRDWKPTMENPPVAEVTVSSEPKCVPEMRPDDVVVAVNGVTLTRANVDAALRQFEWSLSKMMNMKPQDKANAYKRFGRMYIPKWVDRQLVVWESRRLKCVSEAVLRAGVKKHLQALGNKYRMPMESLDKQMPGGLYPVCCDIEDGLWFTAYVTNNVKPTTEVDQAMVDRIKKSIADENAAISASNAVVMARMKEIRKQLLLPDADFGAIADKYDEDESQDKNGTGEWGTFYESNITDEALRKRLFGLNIGEVSEILDDGEYYMVVKMTSRTHPTGNPGDTESRASFLKVSLKHDQLNVLANEGGLANDLRSQFIMRGVENRIAELKKAAKIVYPHGEDFWSSKKMREEAARKRQEKHEEKIRFMKEKDKRNAENAKIGGAK